MESKKIDVWVGLFVLIGAAALLFLALKAGNLLSLNFGPTYDVTAQFDNIGGLKSGAPVKSAGVVVGRVAGIQFDNQTFQAKVKLALDQRYQFPTDTSAKILTSGLLGDQYLSLDPGASSKNLQNGGVIQNTQSAVVLENLIGQFLYNKAASSNSGSSNAAAK
ncbi:MAG: outer membrane lipid asymmetry maintenance protein MlaD [Betaproteobacteria bacterium]|nr:outer membrane lipid asymmetry maintenance protein MlaD [Betaproteobacteria bacterium]MDE2123211.1 outer membrane lipid asymmetry maintenance protein MlaD [Betaproteobacteria bacterium]MDE2186717.1 outer membrane lipid asymmetry maintenance protein MlaD [Betaproteobacteria bacterium]MDE2323941.1 outer membrane lipid asymmetry maintenance protein MlaD [Betaproteobacteria bacterium]